MKRHAQRSKIILHNLQISTTLNLALVFIQVRLISC